MKILVAVEDNSFGRALADFVVAHTWHAQAHFRVVHVVEPIYWGTDIGAYSGAVATDALSRMIEDANRYGDALTKEIAVRIRKVFPEVKVEEVVTEGNPKDELLRMARDWPADMIVLGSHGRTGLERFLLGSVSLAITSMAPCSVMLIRLSHEQAEERERRLKVR